MKVYGSNGILQGMRANADEETIYPIPAGVTVVEFDAATNATLVTALNSNWNSFDLQGGVLRRSGQAVVFAGDSDDEAERKAVVNAVQLMRDYRALASPTNAQTTAAVKLLCRVLIWILVNRIKP